MSLPQKRRTNLETNLFNAIFLKMIYFLLGPPISISKAASSKARGLLFTSVCQTSKIFVNFSR